MSQLTAHSQLEMSEDDRGGFSWAEEMLENGPIYSSVNGSAKNKVICGPTLQM